MLTLKLRHITQGALIAALYVVLTLLSALLGLASGPVQFRISEALCVLPIFTPAAVPGLFVGCIIADVITGCAIWDTVICSLATLAAALLGYLLRRKPYLVPLPNVILNTIAVPIVLKTVYGSSSSGAILALGVFAGEAVCSYGLGLVLFRLLEKNRSRIFK